MTPASNRPQVKRNTTPPLSRATLFAIWVGALEVAIAAYLVEPARFMAAYSVAFAFVITLGLGALFFVILHHLVHARWSDLACLRMERIAQVLLFGPLLFAPLVLTDHAGRPWAALTHSMSRAAPLTAGHLDLPLFCVRSALYLGIWAGLAAWFRYRQDGSNGTTQEARAARLRRLSGPAMILLGLSIVFASFDWWMSLQHGFHSAVFGIYVFAGAVVGSLALLVLLTTWLSPSEEVSSDAQTKERHDLGKLLFGFVSFWAYIAFTQFLLIDYTRLPNEIAFFTLRANPTWKTLTIALVLCHFALPFCLLLPQSAKRSAAVMTLASTLLLVGHYLDVAWLILPAIRPNQPSIGFSELAAASFVFVTLLGVAFGSSSPQRALIGDLPCVESQSDSSLRKPSARRKVALVPNATHAGTGCVKVWSVREVLDATVPFRPARYRSFVTLVVLGAAVGGVITACQFDAQLRAHATRQRSLFGGEVLAEVQAADLAQRNEYRWLNQATGVLRIPVKRARQLILLERLPQQPAVAAAPERQGTQ